MKSLTRDQLNAKAAELGIDAEGLPNKAAVIEAIEKQTVAKVGIYAGKARVLSVRGPFNARTTVDLPTELASELFGEMALGQACRTKVVEAVERDITLIAERDAELAKSGQAALAIQLAFELENPYNSATSKAQCAKALNETIDHLLERAPEAPKKDKLDELGSRRAARLAS